MEFTVDCDAGLEELGAVLSRNHRCVVAYVSSVLTKQEWQYLCYLSGNASHGAGCPIFQALPLGAPVPTLHRSQCTQMVEEFQRLNKMD